MKEAKIANNSSWDQTLSSLHRSLILVSKLKWCRKKIYSSLDQLVLGTFLFAHRLHAGLPLAKVAEQGAFKLKRSGHFLWCKILGKAQKLSAFHKLVKCYGNLQDKFQLTKWVFFILEEE